MIVKPNQNKYSNQINYAENNNTYTVFDVIVHIAAFAHTMAARSWPDDVTVGRDDKKSKSEMEKSSLKYNTPRTNITIMFISRVWITVVTRKLL